MTVAVTIVSRRPLVAVGPRAGKQAIATGSGRRVRGVATGGEADGVQRRKVRCLILSGPIGGGPSIPFCAPARGGDALEAQA